MKWKPAGRGIRYREHPTRKHGILLDRYYSIRFSVAEKVVKEGVEVVDRKLVEEGVGWASQGVKPSDCAALLRELKRNAKTGNGPRTLAEMRTDGEAERLEKERRQRAEAEASVSFRQFFEGTFLPDAKARWTPETTRKAIEHVQRWIDPVTGTLPFRELGLKHINRIKANLADAGRTPRMIQYVCRTFSMVWNAAKDHGLVDTDSPTKSGSFRLPRVDNERQRYLTPDEETALLEAVKRRSQQAHDMAVVALDAALRFGEVAGLTWQCVDLENGALRILDTKGGRDRSVPMTARLKALFASIEKGKPSDLVFPKRNGGRQTQIPSAFKRGLAEAGLNEGVTNPKLRASFHTLRHTGASRLVQAGVDLYRVQRILGHSTPTTTTRYGHLASDDLTDAIERMERNGRKKGAKIIPLRPAASGEV